MPKNLDITIESYAQLPEQIRKVANTSEGDLIYVGSTERLQEAAKENAPVVDKTATVLV